MVKDFFQGTDASKSEVWSFRLLSAAVFLAPLAFLPTDYVALDLVKVCVIVLVAVIGVILQVHVAWKEKSINLIPRAAAWSAFAVVVSAALSSLFVQPIAKSFFGQGFELDTVGFIAVFFVMLCLSYKTVLRRPERAVGIYATAVISFFILEFLHALRFIFGTGFISLGTLTSLTSTVLGNWYALAAYALLVLVITVAALLFLPLSRGVRIGYWIAAIAAFAGAFFVNDTRVWGTATVVFLGMTLYATFSRSRPEGGFVHAWSKRVAWLPLVACAVCAVFAWNGNAIAGKVIGDIGAGYSEIRLPWQQTLDVGAGAIKDSLLLGAGPNRFTQAYIAHKPSGINATDAWSTEFTSGFGLIPTFFVTQGLLGIVAWIMFLVFMGIFGFKALRRVPANPRELFIIVSSYAASVFLWLTLIVSVQPIAIVLLAFVMTGVFFGASVSLGVFSGWTISFETRYARIAPYMLGLVVILAVLWGIVYAKNAIALSYFGAGVKALNVNGDPVAADVDFSKALALDDSDIFWQARAEAGIAAARKAISSVDASSPASTTAAAATKAASIINQSLGYSQKAIAYDPSDYYNYVSLARVSTLGAGMNMAGGYDTAVAAYAQAIKLDPQNPSLYLSLAQLQAQMNKLPDALQTLGQALQVKNNYLDAIYLLSQVEAAQGNLKDAVTAAQVAIQINPQSPLLYFQLGLLEYNNADYGDAASALEKAIAVQPDYSNARYFLGLSYARLGRTKDALTQFSQLAVTNPDNQTVLSVLNALKSGKSPFTPASAPAAAATKAPKLPLKQKGQ